MRFISREASLEFSLSDRNVFFSKPGFTFFSYAREALTEIVREVKQNCSGSIRLLLPDFICHTLIDAVLPLKPEIEFYRIENDFSINQSDLIAKLSGTDTVVLFIDYFGRENVLSNELVYAIRSSGALTIKDGAHSFLAMLNNNFANAVEYDYTISSVYKCIQCYAGAFCLGPLKRPRGGIDFFKLTEGILRHMTKKLLCVFGVTSHINHNTENLIIKDYRAEKTRPRLNLTNLFLFLLSKTDFTKIILNNQLMGRKFTSVFQSNDKIRCVFSENEVSNTVLQAFPIRLQDKKQRDKLFFSLKERSIDCYTWPAFPMLIQREDLWETLLLLPLKREVLEVLRVMI